MFALFFNLYLSMFRGDWYLLGNLEIANLMKSTFNGIGTFLTSLFNNVDTPMATLGDTLIAPLTIAGKNFPAFYGVLALILASITSIGIVVMAVKGVKKAFGIFFGHIR